jgi:hypothetical protein
MDIEQQGRRYFWPVLFISAFALGALLWALWMYQVVAKTRRQQQNGFFVPRDKSPSGAVTNSPAALPPTNSARGM